MTHAEWTALADCCENARQIDLDGLELAILAGCNRVTDCGGGAYIGHGITGPGITWLLSQAAALVTLEFPSPLWRWDIEERQGVLVAFMWQRETLNLNEGTTSRGDVFEGYGPTSARALCAAFCRAMVAKETA